MQKQKDKQQSDYQTKRRVVRIGGILREIITVRDAGGAILEKIARPLALEFQLRDVLQAIVGATLLATPIAFTEEVWQLGRELSLERTLAVLFISLFFLSVFVYYNFYRAHLRGYFFEFFKRIVSIYVLSFFVVGLLLTVIGQVPWHVDWILAVTRAILVTLPASMSAAVADMLK